MSRKKRRAEKDARRGGVKMAAPTAPRRWPYLAAAAAAIAATLIAYTPALRGQFVFDDSYLPFTAAEFVNAPLRYWVLGVRPLLMFSFWASLQLSGLDPFGYHLFNVLVHVAAGLFVFLVLRRLVEFAGERGGRRDALAGFGAALFLLHPIQTESVAYVASRSEVLSVAFFYAALALFLCRRRERISWLEALGVLALFGAAASTKEHTAVLPFVLLLADYYFNPGFSPVGIRRNWRLYVPITAAGAVAAVFILRVLRTSTSAGFALQDFTWWQYFLTQCRAIWLYVRLFLFPAGLNVDHDFAVSRGLLDHGAVVGLIALVAVAVLAVLWRRRYPLASFGVLLFLILLAPTSSFLPIADPVAEHRMYLPLPGLALVVLEGLRRLKPSRALVAACAAVLVVLSAATYARSQVWSTATALWSDAVAKSPRKFRPNEQAANGYLRAGRCREALPHYEAAARAGQQLSYMFFVDWGRAYDCAGDMPRALVRLQHAAAMANNALVYSVIGYIYGKHGQSEQALAALETASRLDPNYQRTYVYRAMVYLDAGRYEAAAEDYRRAVALDPSDPDARNGLAAVEKHLRDPR